LVEQAKTELRSRRRQEGETLQKLYADIRKTLSIAYPGCSGRLFNDIGKDAFLAALPRKLREKVRDREVLDMEEALRVALRYEAYERDRAEQDRVLESKGRAKLKVRKVQEPLCRPESANNELLTVKNALEALRVEYDSLKTNYIRLMQRAQGYEEESDELRRQSSVNTGVSGVSYDGGKAVVRARACYASLRPGGSVCWNCGQDGHQYRDCSSKPASVD
jgi:hypothetical protein